jgi:putative two-component system response regulator
VGRWPNSDSGVSILKGTFGTDWPSDCIRDRQVTAEPREESDMNALFESGRVLVVDDSPSFTQIIRRLMTGRGFDVRTASTGAEALAAIAATPPDVVLLDVMMQESDGFETCRRIKADPETRMIPVVLVTGLDGRDSRIRGMDVGADDLLSKPPDWDELIARVRSLVRLKHYTDGLESAESVMLSLAMTIELRDPYTEGHCQRLANYATSLGERLGLADEDLRALYQGGFLHDLGKVAIPDAILLKPGALSDVERAVIRQHPVVGATLCDSLRSLRRVSPIVRHHHERRDGSGYPDGMVGGRIPLLAQIMSIVDVYDALTTARSYKTALTHEAANDCLLSEVEKNWWCGELVREFIAMDCRQHVPQAENDAMLRLRFGQEATYRSAASPEPIASSLRPPGSRIPLDAGRGVGTAPAENRYGPGRPELAHAASY